MANSQRPAVGDSSAGHEALDACMAGAVFVSGRVTAIMWLRGGRVKCDCPALNSVLLRELVLIMMIEL